MKTGRSIEIVGGGLAGLSLGLALQQRGVATTIHEAGGYPRHRVCGEFVSGLSDHTLQNLGAAGLFADARRLHRVSWHRRGRLLRRHTLPRPAWCVSRHTLDDRFAQAYRRAGGRLMEHSRTESSSAPEGRVFAFGRRRAPSRWLGLKVHTRGLDLDGELEVHLGPGAYVGLCQVEGDRVNVCGLFRLRPGLPVQRETALGIYLRAAGLGTLADRLSCSDSDAESCSAVAGFSFAPPSESPDRLSIGDAYAMLPPFTGNGMAAALQGAETALPPLLAWTRGECDWESVLRVAHRSLHRRFRRRLLLARWLHPFLLHPSLQSAFGLAARLGLLPLRRIAGALHA